MNFWKYIRKDKKLNSKGLIEIEGFYGTNQPENEQIDRNLPGF